MPVKERPTYDELQGYTARYSLPDDIPWSERYPELCMWLNDFDQKGKDQDLEQPDNPMSFRRY